MTDLYHKHEAKLKSRARSFFHNPADAEDALQELQIKLLTLKTGRANNEEAYVVRAATNLFRDLRRKHSRVVQLDDYASIGDGIDDNDPLALLCEDRADEEVSIRLEELPEDLRVVARLYYLHGMSYSKIAKELKLPIGTVGSRLSKAKALYIRT